MANVKISELNSLNKKANDDLVPIVDTSANETKKISIQDLINNNVSLIAVSGEAPEECVEGDKYFNTTTNLIYTATDTDTWSSTGESPIEGIFYIVFEEQTTYAYDGTTLVSVGGGAGGGGDNEPIGKVVPMALETAPDGYLLCDGSIYTKTAYPDLYKALRGTVYQLDDVEFQVPNIQGKVIVGKNASDSDFAFIGKDGGSIYLQEHTHNVLRKYKGSGLEISFNESCPSWNMGDDASTSAGPTSSTGTGNSGNLQPYTTLNYFIKAQKTSGDVILSESLPVGTIVDYDGQASDIPVGWEAYGTGQIKKVAPTTSSPAQVVNTRSNSTEDTYACEYINNSESYSTNEVETNKRWIDGKSIYRKVIQTTIGNAETALNALNCDFATDLKGWYKTSYGFTWQINNYPGADNDSYSLRIYRYTSSGEFTVRYGSYAPTSNDITIIIEYTKTTDNTNTRSLQESKKSVSEDENFEDIEPIEEPIEDENR